MLNNLISGLAALFFWGKTSTKTLEKILNASWLRTFIYGFLTFVVAVFVYKTYQVATIYNNVQVSGIRQGYDSSGHVVDTVKNLYLIHKLAENSMQQNNLYAKEITNYTSNKEINEMLSDGGGAFLKVQAIAHPYEFRQNKIKGWDDAYQSYIDQKLEKANIPHDRVNHLYQVSFLATSIPYIVPFYPKFEGGDDLQYLDKHIFYASEVGNTRNNSRFIFSYNHVKNKEIVLKAENYDPTNNPDILNNGFYYVESIGTVDLEKVEYDCVDLGCVASDNITNKLGVFSAADISQYTYMLTLTANCPVKGLSVEYDIPIEVNVSDEHMSVGTRGFFMDSVMVKSLQKMPAMVFHIKFPSLANLQLIRSLVLTTLLTALFSLFCRNLYFVIRRWAYRKRKKNRIPYSVARKFSEQSKRKIKHGKRSFKRIILGLLFSFIAIIIAATIIVAKNTSILVSADYYDVIYVLPIILLIVSILIIYFAYGKVRKPLLLALSGAEELDSEEPSEEEFCSIFIHENNEEEEYDRLVEEQLRESANQEIDDDKEEIAEDDNKEDIPD